LEIWATKPSLHLSWRGSERVLNFSLTFKGFLSSFLEFQRQKFQGKKKLGAENEREERREKRKWERKRRRGKKKKMKEMNQRGVSVESWR
jgi:hypothetical protein